MNRFPRRHTLARKLCSLCEADYFEPVVLVCGLAAQAAPLAPF